MSIYDLHYTNEDAARRHLEGVRWPDGPFCPHCGSFNSKRLPPVHRKATAKHPASVRDGVVQCNETECRNSTPALVTRGLALQCAVQMARNHLHLARRASAPIRSTA